jgi:hypothetical protein
MRPSRSQRMPSMMLGWGISAKILLYSPFERWRAFECEPRSESLTKRHGRKGQRHYMRSAPDTLGAA